MSHFTPVALLTYKNISLEGRWCCQWYHCIHFIIMSKKKWNMTFSAMCCHWYLHCYRVMPFASSIAPFSSLGEYKWNKVICLVQSCYAAVPVAATPDNDSNVSDNILFTSLRQLKWGTRWTFWSCDASVGITWYNSTTEFVRFKPKTTFLVMSCQCWHQMTYAGNTWHKSTFSFSVSRWAKWDATWDFFKSFDTVGTGISIMWCQWHFQ